MSQPSFKTSVTKSVSSMAFATFLSRILGLLREMLTAQVIGGGMVMTAWGLAFTIPNLFRRLLGEGAIGTAIIPLVRHNIESNGRQDTREQLAVITVFMSLFLSALVMLICVLSITLKTFTTVERLRLMCDILPWVMPYAIFICLAGIMGSILNCLGKFFLPALAALALNVTMIIALALIMTIPILQKSPVSMLGTLSVAVFIAGVAQALVMLILLRHSGMFPAFRGIRLLNWKKPLGELWHLSVPGLIGASALQISLVVDRALACYLGNYAVPALIYSDRLVYLPIGVFAVSVGAVALSNMSRQAARNEYDEMFETLSFSLRQLTFLCVPVAVFLFFYRFELIALFFQRGRFGLKETTETAWALQYYALGVPLFAGIKVLAGGFQSRKDMKTPMKVSLFCILLNIVLSATLMWPLAQGGIALATVISSLFNNVLLVILLKKQTGKHSLRIISTYSRSVAAALLAIGLIILVDSFIDWKLINHIELRRIAHVFMTGTLFVLLYILVSFTIRSLEIREIANIFISRITKRNRA